MEVTRVDRNPTAWLSDRCPIITETNDGLLIIKGDPVFTGIQWLFYISIAAIWIGTGVLWFGEPLSASVFHRVAYGIWCLIVLAIPVVLKMLYPSVLQIDATSKNLFFKYGIVKTRTVVIPFDEIMGIRHKRVFFIEGGATVPPHPVYTDLAYLELKPDVPSITLLGKLLGIAMLSTQSKSMDEIIKFCDRCNIKITNSI